MNMPPRPPLPDIDLAKDGWEPLYLWLEAYGRACHAAAIEEAAKVCDKRAAVLDDKLEERMMRSAAAAIRALKEKP